MAIKCPECNTKNPDDSKFCNECAAPLKPSKDVSITKTLQAPLASPGKTIAGKYKILSELGRGGMGVVYKAKDTRLKRTVALKFLPAELTKDKEAKERFILEAQAAAALDHPNICTVYEVDETENQTFIAMSFIDGQSLQDKLKDGPLDIDVAKNIAIQVAEGLKEAHEKGIVHRDIKPANIMLTKKGQAKITDFGLAKLSWGVDLTKTSTVMGTVAYMSPEQAKGEEVDHRTDIWSLGAMMYEMLTGKRPFKKDQEHALIYSILNEEPRVLGEIRADIPSHIEETIYKALQKDTSNRYQSIQELLKDLKQSAPVTFPKVEKSIVVLPFENLSPDPDQEYFCDGMTEEIISDLSKIQSLRVISRTSAMMLKGTRKSMKSIGRELNVEYVLEGSVRKAGNNLRITAQLIKAASDAHLWAEKYTGTLDDVFGIQENVSHSIVDALKLKLTSLEKQRVSERPIDNIQAYQFYLRAVQEIWNWTEDGFDRAVEDLQNGLRIVGDNALIYAGLGHVYWQYVNAGFKPDDYIEKAEECINKVFELDPDSSKGHFLLGAINQTFRGNQQLSIKHLKKALEINPNDSDALTWLTLGYAGYVGKTSAAYPLVERFIQVDPLNRLSQEFLWWPYFYEGKFELALETSRKWYMKEPDNPLNQVFYAYTLIYNNRFDEAFAIADQSYKTSPNNPMAIQGAIFKHAYKGNKKKISQLMTQELRKAFRRDAFWSYWNVFVYILLEDYEEAFDWLENTINQGWINYPFMSKHDHFLDKIRGEPRFKKLMERVKHEWENFEV